MSGSVMPGKVGWLEALTRFWGAPSVIFLVAVNLVPLYGVVFWGWDLFALMMLYWLETGIIGIYTSVHLVLAGRLLAFLYVPLFWIHFGGFMAGHLVFILALFADDSVRSEGSFAGAVRSALSHGGIWIAAAAMLLSHGFSFFFNVVRPLRTDTAPPQARDPGKVMMQPYGRIVVMHLTIIFGAILVTAYQSKLAAFVLLVALKIAADVASHVRKNFAAQPAAGATGG